MTDLIDELLKKIRKRYQAASVRAIGMAGVQNSENNQKNAEKKGKVILEEAKTSLSRTTSSLEGSIKGQFGKSVKEAFDKQEKKLDSLGD
ncbi:hypothetical protein IGL98_000112 [Enterococcus sp. DIV0840]|uniref:hypothetical protein n=1 Tax=unclassified Enterococcus TaxID=2608891 RepID=UPI000A32C3D0|nr:MULTISPECIES: hypothetical protein [unclassified Enterococcus]MBO0433902.1 hypothetical protein [Enterococcus sp. DIV0849a]OTN83935.1 hypothetical protein A5819_003485 [Enterococcus sp. 7E2_DIV0204]OTP46843.1 hypothetical protein A5884_003721 [Enterococcus sp. 7D2_DIV0200]